MNLDKLRFDPPQGGVRVLQAWAALGALTLVAGALFVPERVWPNLLLASYFIIGMGLAGAFFVALQYVSGAGWSTALRRIPESMSMLLPVGAIGLALVIFFRPSLYPWTGASGAEVEALHGFKRLWLNLPFFIGRSAVYLLAWSLLALAIVRTSRRQDEDGDPSHTRRNERLSAVFLVVFGATFWLASYDWIMSLEPHWYSTIFGIYNFAGLFLGGLAAIIVLAVWLERLGALRHILTQDHLHDLGRLLFAFSTFWAYIWFSQYMLIWYANFPEETSHFILRLQGTWEPLFILNLLLNWAIPFLVLLPRASKRSPGVLLKVAVVILLGRWLDLYLMILPPFAGAEPVFGVWEIGLMLGAVGVGVLVFFHSLRKARIIPVKDPYLMESLHTHS
jgi:hypothetical protein